MANKISPGTKYKFQLILIYLSAIVFCILWLSNKIAINKRIKWDEVQISGSAKTVCDSLHLYLTSDDNEVFWSDSIADLYQFSALYSSNETMKLNVKKFGKKSRKYYSVGTYANTIADMMVLDPEAVKPYLPDISREMDNFCAYLNSGNDEYAERADRELGKIIDALRGISG